MTADSKPLAFEYVGPCGICGSHPDQRHRIRDAQWDLIAAGEDPEVVAATWDWTLEQMVDVWHDIDNRLVDPP